MTIITLGVTVFTVTPLFASENKNVKRVFNGTAQMTVAELKNLQAEKKEAGADKDDGEVKRYLSGEVTYFDKKAKMNQQRADGGQTLQIDPEDTLTKEQEEEVLDTTEIERYVKTNYSVLQQFTNESEYTTKARQAVISYAMQFIGNPYVWGGTSLTNGADCSGFVQEIFRHFGIVTGRTSRDQYANCVYLKGKEVMPGDLIFYADETGYINHVAIYAGNYMIVHAANRKAGIKVNRYDYKQPYAYGRFIAN